MVWHKEFKVIRATKVLSFFLSLTFQVRSVHFQAMETILFYYQAGNIPEQTTRPTFIFPPKAKQWAFTWQGSPVIHGGDAQWFLSEKQPTFTPLSQGHKDKRRGAWKSSVSPSIMMARAEQRACPFSQTRFSFLPGSTSVSWSGRSLVIYRSFCPRFDPFFEWLQDEH